MTADLRGIYAIANDTLMTSAHFLASVEGALAGGIRLLQYRHKAVDARSADRRMAVGCELLELCKQYNVPLLINDDVEFCAEIGAQGVHLGQRDSDCRSARTILGPDAIIGITCHNSLTLGHAAADAGADYVAFGCFFPSVTKPEATPAAFDTLVMAREQLDVPLVAIGGINAGNGNLLIEAGADLLAVIHDLFGELGLPEVRDTKEHVRRRAERLVALFP